MHIPNGFLITLIPYHLTSLNFFIKSNFISGLVGKGKIKMFDWTADLDEMIMILTVFKLSKKWRISSFSDDKLWVHTSKTDMDLHLSVFCQVNSIWREIQLVVMSPSRAGSSHSSRWRIFSSARDLFDFSSELKIDWKTSWNFNSQLKTYFLSFSIRKLTKLCIWIKLFTFKNTKVQINDHNIDWNHDTGLLIIKTWGKNEVKNFWFSSVSARKLKCPS